MASAGASALLLQLGDGQLIPASHAAEKTGWQTLPLGAGGYICGMDIAPDGTKVIRTDTYGAYWWDGSTWVQLITYASLPGAQLDAQERRSRTPHRAVKLESFVHEFRDVPLHRYGNIRFTGRIIKEPTGPRPH